MAPQPIDGSIAAKVKEIRAQPYAKAIVSEDSIERNFGYKIIRQQISAGKNSIIYRCEKFNSPETHCIIKSYPTGKARIKQALREETCQIMRYLNGKCVHLISVFDIFYTNEKIYLMCDWSAKGELVSNIRRKTIRLNEDLLRVWAQDLMTAVNFLHSNAICHRNISPGVLLLTQDDRVKIGSLVDAVVYCEPDGTLIRQKWPKFSRSSNWNQAPEVAKGRTYDPRRADVWSLGATIFWIATGTHPINYRSANKLTKQLDRNIGIMRKVSSNCQKFLKYVLNFQPTSRPTVGQAMQHEWVTGVSVPETSRKQQEPEEIVVSEKAQDTVDTTGPDEQVHELENSTNNNNHNKEQTQQPEKTTKMPEQ